MNANNLSMLMDGNTTSKPLESLSRIQQKARRDRLFQNSQGWYFATREGVNMGPFPDQSCAELELLSYIKSMQNVYEKKNYHSAGTFL